LSKGIVITHHQGKYQRQIGFFPESLISLTHHDFLLHLLSILPHAKT